MSNFNQELFQKIHDQITQHPGTHDQDSWESYCGTTRCVAGWAVHFSNGERDLWVRSMFGRLTPSTKELFQRVLADQHVRQEPGSEAVERTARTLLGLNAWQARGLFYGASRVEARELVKLAAEGRDEEFDKYLVGAGL